MKLTQKQEMFCLEYLKDLNATQASIRAGYSEKTAQRIGSENLSKPVISERIQELMSEREKVVKIDALWVLEQAKESYLINAKVSEEEDGKLTMVNATAAGKFLEMCGKHVNVKAFAEEKDTSGTEDLVSAIGALINKLPN